MQALGKTETVEGPDNIGPPLKQPSSKSVH
jgi:hypothetical protein